MVAYTWEYIGWDYAGIYVGIYRLGFILGSMVKYRLEPMHVGIYVRIYVGIYVRRKFYECLLISVLGNMLGCNLLLFLTFS